MIKYSLLCPTKNRLVKLQNYLQSIRNTATNKQEIEILLAIDNNDTPTVQHTQQHLLNVYNDLIIKPYYREESEMINRDYYTWLAGFASGKYIWIAADDLLYIVPGWDIHIENRIETYLQNKPDRIVCVGIQDNTPKPNSILPPFPCFPLITKEAFQLLGFILHPQVPTWGADYLIYQLYTQANRYLAIDDNVYIRHISYHTREESTADHTTENVGRIFNRLKMRPEHNIQVLEKTLLPQQIEQIRNHITNWKG